METVFVVSITFPNLDAVDDNLVVYGYNIGSTVGIYSDRKKAEENAEELCEYYAKADDELECGHVDVYVTEWEVQ